ncbi:MAG TPA: PIG-L deacetylase family protein [Mucilaginibacter sp.]|nr:PIG-L deacetylase family protein [Mucilaginibacter sp.]
MKTNKTARRDFLKLSAIALSGIALAPAAATAKPKTGTLCISSADDKKLSILCLGAHPGDPEFGCGGTMARYSEAGHHVTFLYITRGEASDSNKSYAEMAALRTAEAETACKILNANPQFFGQVDGNTVLDKSQNDKITKLISTVKPDLVFTQWPVDGHPDHQVTGTLALTAWVRSNRTFHLYFYEVNTGVETMGFTPTDYVDITAMREKKKQAMFAHKTQNPVKTYNDYFKPLEEFRGLEAGVQAAEAFIHFKPGTERASLMGLH